MGQVTRRGSVSTTRAYRPIGICGKQQSTAHPSRGWIRWVVTLIVANDRSASAPMGPPSVRVLLTGGAGFIGSHVAEHLLAQGYEVAIIDDLSSGKRENLPTGARFYEADIRSGCGQILEEFEPEALCHHAAQIDVRRSVRAGRVLDWRPEVPLAVGLEETLRYVGAL